MLFDCRLFITNSSREQLLADNKSLRLPHKYLELLCAPTSSGFWATLTLPPSTFTPTNRPHCSNLNRWPCCTFTAGSDWAIHCAINALMSGLSGLIWCAGVVAKDPLLSWLLPWPASSIDDSSLAGSESISLASPPVFSFWSSPSSSFSSMPGGSVYSGLASSGGSPSSGGGW